MFEGRDSDEPTFDWKKTILNFRKYISKLDDDIFSKSKKVSPNEINTVRGKVDLKWI